MVISNVPGAPVALYFAGAKLLTYYPVSIPSHGMALNMTVQSYNGMLDFGLIACRRAVPDVEDIADYLVEEHRAILARVKAIEASEATPHLAAATAANAAAKPPKAPARKKAAPPKAAARKTPARKSAQPPRLRADAQAGRPGLHAADHARPRSKPCARNSASTSSTRVGRARTPAGRRWSADRSAAPAATGGSAGVELHLGAVAGPVAARGAGDEAVAPPAARTPRQQRHARPVDAAPQPGAARHLERVAGQAEAGDVGQRMHAVAARPASVPGVLSWVVVAIIARVAGGVELLLLQRGRQHADAERLAEHQQVAGLAHRRCA